MKILKNKPFIVIAVILLCFALVTLLSFITSFLPGNRMNISDPTKYTECAARRDSIIQDSYPSVCITSSGRRFVEEVKTPAPNTTGTCVVSGCSGELCVAAGSDETASICVYKSEYQCYKTATCEVQANGTCGWTQTAELKSCLTAKDNAPSPTTGGTFCGGIAGMVCPLGFSCQLDGNYPDAGGKCVKQDTSTPTIQSPKRDSTVKSPVTVTGSVPPGWMFEGSFPIKIIDSSGKTLVQGVAHEKTPGTWMSGKSIPFEATLTFTTSATSGEIVLQKDNPSGETKNDASYSLSIRF